MGEGSAQVIQAAGGVLWRPALGGAGVEVALVHRPKYDDWSIPKGKLSAHEHLLVAAVREVFEETGYACRPGRPLGEIRYLKDGVPKRVRYWAMEAGDGEFVPGDEVDQLMWLPPREAMVHLTRDEDVITGFLEQVAPTYPVLIARHGSAGERAEWSGDDRARPLDAAGRTQAAVLAGILEVLGIERVVSADVLRCLETTQPYAVARKITVEDEPLLSERGYAEQPEAAVQRLASLVRAGRPTVVSSQGRAIPGLIAGVCAELGVECPDDPSVRKGGFWVLHVNRDDPDDLVALDRFPPVA